MRRLTWASTEWVAWCIVGALLWAAANMLACSGSPPAIAMPLDGDPCSRPIEMRHAGLLAAQLAALSECKDDRCRRWTDAVIAGVQEATDKFCRDNAEPGDAGQ